MSIFRYTDKPSKEVPKEPVKEEKIKIKQVPEKKEEDQKDHPLYDFGKPTSDKQNRYFPSR